MREIVVLSGKGGTGKTTLTGVFATLGYPTVLADADVDAANLHIILEPLVLETEPFSGGRRPVVDQEKCTRCGVCTELCRFEAIRDGTLDEIACEGCGVCFHACPMEAVKMQDVVNGYVYTCSTRYGPFVYAELGIAEENSGKLVVRVKQRARALAEQEGKEYLVVDGPPGIGCPVIASLAGASLALVVTEPTPAGLHLASNIENYCRAQGVPLTGRIPFAREVVASLVAKRPLTADGAGEAAQAMRDVWQRTLALL